MISRNIFKADIGRMYIKEKTVLKELFVSIPSRMCLTSYLWTSINTEGFISLTAHFVDLNWKLNSKLLNFCHMPPPHIGFEFPKKIYEFEKKNSITLDNASANDVLKNTFKSQLLLQNGLVCGGEFFNVRCCVHILNLIVQEGLKVLGEALNQIRNSIKYVRGLESRMVKFKQCLENNVPTRWNSTYLMLKSALNYHCVFGSLHLVDESYKYYPSKEDWERAKKICKFLLLIYDIITMVSATSYPTSNLYFLQV